MKNTIENRDKYIWILNIRWLKPKGYSWRWLFDLHVAWCNYYIIILGLYIQVYLVNEKIYKMVKDLNSENKK
jgi:hypothetical protein